MMSKSLLLAILAVVKAQESSFPSDAPSLVPSLGPSFFPTPGIDDFNFTQSDICELNENCNALNLTGKCCPTLDNWTLDCCGPQVKETCQDNPKCEAFGLEGACCPTEQGKYLDCCDVIPAICKEKDDSGNDNCEFQSVSAYLAEQNAAPSTSSPSIFRISTVATGIVLSMSLLL